jgi:hypothetical protein
MASDRFDGARSAWCRFLKLLPYALTAAYLLFLSVAVSRHEMWRDETQAWLLMRDCSSCMDIATTIKYEGHPGLWHALLWPAAQLTGNPVAMQLVHVIIAGLAAFLVFRFAPFPWLVKIALMCGYYFAYEWAVIARNYAISVLLFFLFCALFEKRWRRFPVLAAVLFGLCHTNVHSLIIVMVLSVTLAVEFAVAYAGRFREADRFLGRVLLGFAIVLVGIYTSVRQITPPKDSNFATEWYFKADAERFQWVASAVLNAYLPVQADRLPFWYSNRFQEPPPEDARIKWWVPNDKRIRFGFLVLGAGCLFFIKRPWLMVPYLASSFGVLSFLYVKYPGWHRHHGFLFLIFVMMLWMSHYYKPWRIPWRKLDWPFEFWDRHRVKVFCLLLVLPIWGTWVAVKVDREEQFSMAKVTAEWLRSEFSDFSEVLWVGLDGPPVSAVVGYAQIESMFYPQRGEFGSHMIWDSKWSRFDGMGFKARVGELMEQTGKDAVIIANRTLPGRPQGEGIEHLKSFEGGVIGDENFHVYFWKNTDGAGSD